MPSNVQTKLKISNWITQLLIFQQSLNNATLAWSNLCTAQFFFWLRVQFKMALSNEGKGILVILGQSFNGHHLNYSSFILQILLVLILHQEKKIISYYSTGKQKPFPKVLNFRIVRSLFLTLILKYFFNVRYYSVHRSRKMSNWSRRKEQK